MQTGPSPSAPGQVQAGSVVALWRYPVKSMMGEELNACGVTDRGLLGDRQFAVVDRATGKVGGAKNPRKWGSFFGFRATYPEPPRAGARAPRVRITLPDGAQVMTGQGDLEQVCRGCSGGTWPWRRRGPGRGRWMPRPRSTGRIWPAWTTGTR